MKNILQSLLQRRVFASVLMWTLLIAGLLSCLSIRQELLPPREADKIEVAVELQGASPDEISSSVLAAIENAVANVPGIKRIDSQAREGSGIVNIKAQEGYEIQKLRNDIQSSLERITIFPQDLERPVVSIPSEVERALSIIVYGDQPLGWLRQVAETVRDDLQTQVGLTKVQLAFPRDMEISVEISEENLNQHGLTLLDIAEIIRENSLELPGGTLYSKQVEVGIRTGERKRWAPEFAGMVIDRDENTIPIRLADLAEVKDGFGDSPIDSWFNGNPAIQIDVFAVGDETPISVEADVRNYLSTYGPAHQGVEIVIFENQAAAYHSRIGLLIENGLCGLLLVLVLLCLFLSPNLTFWVVAGIPTSLLGGVLLLSIMDISINMISLFAFIVTIGVVVDDAIMMSEAIHSHRQYGTGEMGPLEAAVKGVREMGLPILLATSTTIIGFLPMFFVPGELGILFRQIPSVVVAVLLVSLLESLFILPAHLAKKGTEKKWLLWISGPQRWINGKLDFVIATLFQRLTHTLLRNRLLLVSTSIGVVLITLGAISGGLLGFSFTPTIQSDTVIAQATLPYGASREQSITVQQKLVDSANVVLKQNNMTSPGIFSLVGTRLDEGEVEMETLAGSHYISALVALPPPNERTISGIAFAAHWQKMFGNMGELEALNFTGETNVMGGEPIQLEVFNNDETRAREAAIELGKRLRAIPGLTSVDDGVRTGKPEIRIRLNDYGQQMGLSPEDLGHQIRNRFHGVEALRFIRDGNEVKVVVRLAEEERYTQEIFHRILLKNPAGLLVPLSNVADISMSHSHTNITRRDGRRIYPVAADIGYGVDDDMIEDLLEEEILPQLLAAFAGTSVHFGGEEEEMDEALKALGKGFIGVLAIIYLLFSLHFNSYVQPLIVLAVIPFSFIGAVWGHILLGYDLSIISLVGMVAMAGVVVNDSMVLVTTYNNLARSGQRPKQAIIEAASRRFRPILLTTLTTFFGLFPLLLEKSEQAQFLIPAALSMSSGLLFGMVVTLVFVPALVSLQPENEKSQSQMSPDPAG